MSCRCECGWPVYSDYTISVTCPQCNGTIDCDGTIPEKESTEPATRWPLWATLIQWKSTPEDKGVGDTVHRLLSLLGAEAFKVLATSLGIPCGCAQRQDSLNQRFPYERDSQDAMDRQ